MPTPPVADEDVIRTVEVRSRCASNVEAARERGVDEKTVRRHMVLAAERGLLGPLSAQARAAEVQVVPASTHASRRADSLRDWIQEMLTGTMYPVVNPDAVHVEPQMGVRYDKRTEDYVEVEKSPKTWVSETLRVAPVRDSRGMTFIFTGAQNDAPIHEDFWENLRAYAAFIDAQIVVGPWTYETSWFNENSTSARSYDSRILPHIAFGQMAVGDHFMFAGEMNTLPTASRPISDLVTYSRGRWAVFPHAKIQLKSVPSTDPGIQAHQVMTSGAVTRPKVIPRKAGIKSIFHHVIGATLVEFDSVGDVFCRQINAADDGSFYDLDRHVNHGEVTVGHGVRAVVCGDIHARKLDHNNSLATFGFGTDALTSYQDNIIDTLRPEVVLLHDVFDNEARNHHHAGDSAYSYEMAIRGRDRIIDEVRVSAIFVARVARQGTRPVVVESNHDLGLERYVREGRYRNDGANVRDGLKLEDAYMAAREAQATALDSGKPVPTFSLFEAAARDILGDDLRDVGWVHDGQSYVVDGVECGNHGFRGANGAKGTVSGFARIGRKMSIGDKHSPEIMDGVYCAGAMNLRHGYNKGPSSWAVSHIVQYQNGKRALITLQNGKWRAAKPVVRVRVPVAANDNEPVRGAA